MQEEKNEQAEATRARLEKYLQGKPFYFNPDPDIVDSIIRAIVKRCEKFGQDYCPCRRVTGNETEDAAIVCPCVYHEQEIEEQGHCHCMLFTSI